MKHVSSVFIVVVAATACFVLASMANSHDRDRDDKDSRVERGYKISPVQLNTKNKSHDKVGLGSYLVNAVGSCNDCHTCPSYRPGHNPYLGEPKPWINSANYLAGGVPFGPFTSANLTPDSNGHPAGLTLGQFIHTIRTGKDPHPEPNHPPLLQVMPWPVLRNMTDDDLEAIYAYLSAVPPAQPGSCTGAGE
jgi:hypothetical protein